MRHLSVGLVLISSVLAWAAAPPPPAGLEDPLPESAVARFGTARFRGEGRSSGALLSPDGKLLAISAFEGMHLLDSTTGKVVRRVKAERSSPVIPVNVANGRFSPDGRLLAASDLRGIIVCDVARGEIVARVEQSRRPTTPHLSFSANGKWLALGGDDIGKRLSVAIWDVVAKRMAKTFEVRHARRVDTALSPDGKTLATWGFVDRRQEGPAIQLWDVATGKESRALDVDGLCTAVVFSPDGKHLLAASGGSSLGIWDVASGKQVRRFVGRRVIAGTLLAFSADGKRFAAGTPDGVVQLWDAVGGRVGQCDAPPGTRLTSLSFLPDGTVLAAGLAGHSIRLWEVPSGRERTPRGGHLWPVTSIAFSRDGKTLFSGGGDGVRSWEVAAGKQVGHYEAPHEERASRGNPVYFVSPEGRYVLAEAANRGGLRVIDRRSGQEIAELPWSSVRTNSPPVFAGGGDVYAALGMESTREGRFNSIRVGNLRTGLEHRTFRVTRSIDEVHFSLTPDAKALAIVSGGDLRGATPGEVKLHDTATGKVLFQKAIGERVSGAAFSPDGEVLAAVCTEGAVRLWDVATGVDLPPLRGEGRIPYSGVCAFAPDGRTLAVVREGPGRRVESEVQVWELGSGQVRTRLAGPPSRVVSLAFSPDGGTLATGGGDTTVLLWDVTGRTAARREARPTGAEVAGLWTDLSNADAAKAYRAMGRLSAARAEAVALFARELKPKSGAPLGEKEVRRLVEELGDDSFATREKATAALRQAGAAVRPALLLARKESSDLERNRRLEELLKALNRRGGAPELLRQARALEVLERFGTAEANKLLDVLAKGNPGAMLTKDARAALDRARRAR